MRPAEMGPLDAGRARSFSVVPLASYHLTRQPLFFAAEIGNGRLLLLYAFPFVTGRQVCRRRRRVYELFLAGRPLPRKDRSVGRVSCSPLLFF